MNHLVKVLTNLFTSPKTNLMLVDGDNISAIALKNTIKSYELGTNIRIEVFCNCVGARGWLKEHEFDEVVYNLVKTEPQAADLKLKSKIIELLANYSTYNFTHIYLATNDHTFKSDITFLSKIFPTSVISSSGYLLSIPSINAIPIISITEKLDTKAKNLVQHGDSLATVGSLFKKNDIAYKRSLSNFLQSNGFIIKNGIVTETPTVKVHD